MKSYIVPIKRLVLLPSASKYCQLPYPNHPKGCPNYNKKPTCPPHAPLVEHVYDLQKPLYFVHSEFNLGNHIVRMKIKHPLWSELQCRCVLYWQGTSRKQLKERVQKAEWTLNTNALAFCPEAMGVNVYATARVHGLKLERIRHLNICRHIALIGTYK